MEALRDSVKSILLSLLQDPIVSLLLSRSSITKQQFSTLIVDIISDNLTGEDLTYEDKASCMLKPISRGAYNRILIQARRNITKSFFTILLLSYVGILEDSQISKLIELGEKLRSIIEAYRREGIDQSEIGKAIARLAELIESYVDHRSYARRRVM
ncbi:MAG: hypothetical protein N3E44_02680 [Candidatus Bathyarchaeota archaeon]|nr:hypothetical protein [Candidatus Bathyarchaeota archaeon]